MVGVGVFGWCCWLVLAMALGMMNENGGLVCALFQTIRTYACSFEKESAIISTGRKMGSITIIIMVCLSTSRLPYRGWFHEL
jgi:hypothetical protein